MGRGRIYTRRTHRGAPNPGGQWSPFRIYRGRGKNRPTRLCNGKDLHAPGSRPGPKRGTPAAYRVYGGPCARRCSLGNHSHGRPASISDRNSKAVQALSEALESVWGKRPVFKREGGSVPVVAQFQEILGIESVNTGFGLPSDNMHSPNEKLHLPTWANGIDALVHYLYNLVK
jgi:acetylornithine deacetylase/succinyl-diaminopimelate desuccinylase-like protein